MKETNCIPRGSSRPSNRSPIEQMFIEHLLWALDIGDTVVKTAGKSLALPVPIFWIFCGGKRSPGNIRVLQLWPGAAEQTKQG